MSNKEFSDTGHLYFSSLEDFLLEVSEHTQFNEAKFEGARSYRIALGREVMHLGIVEFRILLLLASKPYHPFTRQCIVDAINSESHPVTENTVDQYIASLRDQLGFFHDLVQSVPYVGYRFKA